MPKCCLVFETPLCPGPSPIIWNYGNESRIDGGVRLEVLFDHDRLIEVRSWVRTFWREVSDDGPRPTTFRLTASDDIERREFAKIYCPDR